MKPIFLIDLESYRDEDSGSIFIQAFCKAMSNHLDGLDVLSITSQVHYFIKMYSKAYFHVKLCPYMVSLAAVFPIVTYYRG